MTNTRLDGLWQDPAHWSAFGIYRCEADPRLVVPKRVQQAGWTVNFARAGAWPLLMALVGAGVLPVIVLLSLGPPDPLALVAVLAGSAIAVLVLTLAANRIAQGRPLFPRVPLGRIPAGMEPLLQGEGIVLRDENLHGTVTFRRYRAPGKIYSFRRNWFRGSLVWTELRFAAFATFRTLINVPIGHAHMAALDCSLEKGTTLCVGFEAGVFDARASGRVEIRFKTPKAALFLERLAAGGARVGGAGA